MKRLCFISTIVVFSLTLEREGFHYNHCDHSHLPAFIYFSQSLHCSHIIGCDWQFCLTLGTSISLA